MSVSFTQEQRTEIGSDIVNSTAGSILYVGSGSVLAQDNNNFYYDFTNKRLGVGTLTPNSTIQVSGSLSTKINTVTANTTLDETYHTILADATLGSITITLPTAVGVIGREYLIKKTDATLNLVVIDGDGTETIDGNTTKTLALQNASLSIKSDGTNWQIQDGFLPNLGTDSVYLGTSNPSLIFENDGGFLNSTGLTYWDTTNIFEINNSSGGIVNVYGKLLAGNDTTTTSNATLIISDQDLGNNPNINLKAMVGGVSSPTNGDMWYNGTNLYFYNGVVSKDLLVDSLTTPGGDNTQIQFNSSGSFGASANLVYTTTGGLGSIIPNSSATDTAGLTITRGNTQTNRTRGIYIDNGNSVLITNKSIELSSIISGSGLYIPAVNTSATTSGGGNGVYIGSVDSGSNLSGGNAYGVRIDTVSSTTGLTNVRGISEGIIRSSTGSGEAIGFAQFTLADTGAVGTTSGIRQNALNNATNSANTVYGIYQDIIKSNNNAGSSEYGIYQNILNDGTKTAGDTVGYYIANLNGFNRNGGKGKFASWNNAQIASLTNARTESPFEILHSRVNQAISGTLADNFSLVNFKRTSIQGQAGGTFTSTGSVLKLENVATQTAGTLTDSVKVLHVIQDTNSTGAVAVFEGGNVGIATTTPTSKLHVNGSFSLPTTTKTADYTATITDYTIRGDATAGNIIITLPTAVGITGRIYVIKKVDSTANTITVDGSGSETIDGALTQVISSQYISITIQSNGTSWDII